MSIISSLITLPIKNKNLCWVKEVGCGLCPPLPFTTVGALLGCAWEAYLKKLKKSNGQTCLRPIKSDSLGWGFHTLKVCTEVYGLPSTPLKRYVCCLAWSGFGIWVAFVGFGEKWLVGWGKIWCRGEAGKQLSFVFTTQMKCNQILSCMPWMVWKSENYYSTAVFCTNGYFHRTLAYYFYKPFSRIRKWLCYAEFVLILDILLWSGPP